MQNLRPIQCCQEVKGCPRGMRQCIIHVDEVTSADCTPGPPDEVGLMESGEDLLKDFLCHGQRPLKELKVNHSMRIEEGNKRLPRAGRPAFSSLFEWHCVTGQSLTRLRCCRRRS